MDIRKIMDIFAYYLSEYDNSAFSVLGFDTQTAGFNKLAGLFGKKPSYLRRLRDEYDVVTSSTRKGQRNRPPRDRIVETKKHLEGYSFPEITEIVQAFIKNAEPTQEQTTSLPNDIDLQPLSEADIEGIINYKDENATIRIKTGNNKIRVYDTAIIKQLKKLYKGHCQLCGSCAYPEFNTDICEAHHIEYYASSLNNNSANIIVLCPNHHRLVHKLNPSFNRGAGCFEFDNGKKIEIAEDYHLLP